MVKMLVAHTSEIDEINDAIDELKSQIDFTVLKKNTGGIIFCHIDFIESGVVAEVCKAFPFEIIGMTSMASASKNGYGLYDLTLTLLTSDDVSFKTGMTNGINKENYANEVNTLYKNMRSEVSEDPTMILSFMPYIREVSGYEVVDAMDKAVGGIPIWGSITNNVDFNYETVQTLCNGKHLSAGVAMMFINGPVEPKFIVSSLPEHNIYSSRAIITKSEGSVLYDVNDMPVLEYLKNIGLVINKENITTTPFMVYYGSDVKPTALGFYTLFEDGSVLTGGEMPVGTSIAVGSINTESIFESAETGLKDVLAIENRQATLLLPCVTRYIMLAPDQESELRLISDKLNASGLPFIMGYSGGEICPVPDGSGKLHNRFHNYTFCACVL